MKALSIKKFSDFVTFVEKEYKNNQSEIRNALLLFRGQDVDMPLLPKLARELKVKNELGIGHLSRYDFHSVEMMMLEEFKRRARPLLDREPESECDWLSIAQHHGLHTRLLDWTENPLVALFFALIDSGYERDSIVWLLRIDKKEILKPNKELDIFNQDTTKIFKPNFVSKRLIAQSGWFSIHKYLKGKNIFIPLEDNARFKKFLTKILIQGDMKTDMIKQLDACGINSSTLFPDLDGMCGYLNWWATVENHVYIQMPRSIRDKTQTQ